jgi:hypothetical protein
VANGLLTAGKFTAALVKGVMSYKHFPRAAVARTRAMNQQNLVNTVAKAFMHTIGR